jgi:uncharacterized membrane protein (DUF373 family)
MQELYKEKESHSPYLDREKIVNFLQTIQDLIVVLLCIGLFGVMLIKVGILFLSLMHPLHFHLVTSDILFLLILVELFRLLIIYLQERQISVVVAVEVSIVSVLRELILSCVLEISNSQVNAICETLLILGGIMLIPTLERILSQPSPTPVRQPKSKAIGQLNS